MSLRLRGDNVVIKFVIKNRTDAQKADVNLLRWLDRLKNEDIHQIYDVFENTIFKALEHL